MHFPRDPDAREFETSPILRFGEVSNALIERRSSSFQADGANGTKPAIDNPNSGGSAESAPRPRRGGAHNSAARQSHALSSGQIANLIAAEAHAAKIGLPFNRMITIHWEAAGVPLEGMAQATGRFIDLLTKAISRHGGRTAWLWVHEGGEHKGGHCHLLTHVPTNLVPKISKLQRGWLRRITRRPYKANVIHSRPIGGRLGLEDSNPELLARNRQEVLGYVIKGAGTEAVSVFGLSRSEPGGLIVGKRCGTSQNIGLNARNS